MKYYLLLGLLFSINVSALEVLVTDEAVEVTIPEYSEYDGTEVEMRCQLYPNRLSGQPIQLVGDILDAIKRYENEFFDDDLESKNLVLYRIKDGVKRKIPLPGEMIPNLRKFLFDLPKDLGDCAALASYCSLKNFGAFQRLLSQGKFDSHVKRFNEGVIPAELNVPGTIFSMTTPGAPIYGNSHFAIALGDGHFVSKLGQGGDIGFHNWDQLQKHYPTLTQIGVLDIEGLKNELSNLK